MARQSATRQSVTKQSNSFINGIVTDSNEFAAPENAAKDMLNVDINQKGEAIRRRGLEPAAPSEDSTVLTAVMDEAITQCVRWDGAGGDRSASLVVCQLGEYIKVYDNSDSSWYHAITELSTSSLTGESRANLEKSHWHMVPGDDGALYIVTGVSKPIRITYSTSTNLITGGEYELYARDTAALPDTLDVDARFVGVGYVAPTNHLYNLLNTGWDSPNLKSTKDTYFHYPSKAEQQHRAKTATGLPDLPYIHNLTPASGPSPLGRYIWPLWLTDRASILALAISTPGNSADERVIPSGTGPTTCSFYANRLFYAGFTTTSASPDGLGSTIYYSQVVTSNSNASNHDTYAACYSVNDPSSEHFNEVLATDGGSIFLPGVGEVRRIVPLGNTLLIFSSNGVWSLDGGYGEVFKADSFSLNKVSNSVTIAYRSIIEAGASVVFWTTEGILSLSQSPTEKGSFVVNDVVDKRFKEGYLQILENYDFVSEVQGFYDDRNQYLQWTYSSGSSSEAKHGHSDILRVNIKTGAITLYGVITPVIPPRRIGTTVLFNQTGDQTTVYYLSREEKNVGLGMNCDWNSFTNITLKDYEGTIHEGEELPYIALWPEHIGAPHLNKQATYLHTFVRRTEENWISAGTFDKQSGITVTGYWDWAEENNNGKRTGPHNVYRMLRLPDDPGSGYPVGLDYYPTIIINKTKIKGKGRAIQLRFDGIIGKDFQLIGWSVPITVEVV